MLFNRVEEENKFVNLLVHSGPVLVVDHKCDWQVFKGVLIQGFTRFLHILKYLVFLGDARVVFKVVY